MDFIHEKIDILKIHIEKHLFLYSKIAFYIFTVLVVLFVVHIVLYTIHEVTAVSLTNPAVLATSFAFALILIVGALRWYDAQVNGLVRRYLEYFETMHEE